MDMKTILAGVALVILAAVAYVRFVPGRVKAWHVDPLLAKKPNRPNAFIMRPGTGKYPAREYDVDAAVLAQAFDDFVLAQPNVKQLAGGPGAGFTTYVARTPLMGYPDYISVRAVDLGGGRAALVVFSRARFGYSDGGMNRKRMLLWLKEFKP